MSMKNENVGFYNSLGASAAAVDERSVAYASAAAAAAGANNALAAAKAALDVAVVDFREKDATFDTAIMSLPAGYVPPL